MRLPRFLSGLIAPRWPQLIAFALFFLLGSLIFFGNPAITQPIAFNHAKHLETGLQCTDCHSGAKSQARATLPPLSACLVCHETALTKSAEEAKIRALAAAGQETPWVQLTRVPAHVYFSHRRHAQQGGIDCAVCHGSMEKLTAPPRRPYREFTMDACIQCHEKSRARTDCDDCHR
jgi:hypothetical protein